MNVSQLRPGLFAQSTINASHQDGASQGADFLSFKLLNKRARLRLSNESLDLDGVSARAELFAVAASKSWFAAVIRKDGIDHIILSPSSQLREEATTCTSEKSEVALTARHAFALPSRASVITFAQQDTRLIVGGVNGTVCVYDCSPLFSGGSGPSSPSQTFPSSAGAITAIQPNPEGIPELVAICHDTQSKPGLQAVVILDLNNSSVSGAWSSGSELDAVPSSISWSPKGKQIAIGFRNGGIATYLPGDTSSPKFVLPPPQSISNHSVLGLTWLSNTLYHIIYVSNENPAADSEQTHYIVTADAKTNSASYVRMNPPYLPFPGIHMPAPFSVVFRDWSPAKYLVLAGDSASSDLGVLSCTENWYHVSLEEGSAPTLPLTADMDDTVLVGLQVDTGSSTPFMHSSASGASAELPPPPVLYAYASDGTVQAWHVVNSSGAPYNSGISIPSPPSMRTATSVAMMDGTLADGCTPDQEMEAGPGKLADTPLSFGGMSLGTPNSSASSDKSSSMFGPLGKASTTTPMLSPFGSSGAFSQGFGAFGSSSTAQTSPFSNSKPASAFGNISLDQSAFGQSTFGSSSSAPSAFAQTSPPTASAFGQSGSGQSAFGQSTFGVSAPSQSGFGSSAFGNPAAVGGAFRQSAFGQASTFGSKGAVDSPTPSASASFGGSGGGGFACFAGTGVTGLSAQTLPKEASTTPSTPATSGTAFGGTTSSNSTTPKNERPVSAFAIGSTTPAESPKSSPFGGPSTPLKQNAFSAIVSQPNAFKPRTGFGAFGALESEATTSSPFFSPTNSGSPGTSGGGFASAFGSGSAFKPPDGKDTSSLSNSVFGSPSTPSTFGSSSPFGGQSAFGVKSAFPPATGSAGKSVFGSTSAFPAAATATSAFGTTTPPTTPKEPVSGGFSAFTSSSSAFTKAAESKSSSFTELMKDKKPPEPTQGDGKGTGAKIGENVDGSDMKEGLDESISSLSQLSDSFEKIDHDESASQQGDDDGDGGSYDSGEYSGDEDDGRSLTPPPEDNEEDADEGEGELSDDNNDEHGHEQLEEEEEGEAEEDKTVDGKKTGEPQAVPSPVSSLAGKRSEITDMAPKERSPPFLKSSASATPSSFSFTTPSAGSRSSSTTPPGSPVPSDSSKPFALEAPPEKPTLFGKMTTKPARSSPLATGQVIRPGDDSSDATGKPVATSAFTSFASAAFPAAKPPIPPFAAVANPTLSVPSFTLGAAPGGTTSSPLGTGPPALPFSFGSNPSSSISGPQLGTAVKSGPPASTFSLGVNPPLSTGAPFAPLPPKLSPSSFSVRGPPPSKPFPALPATGTFSLPLQPSNPPPLNTQASPPLAGIELVCHDMLMTVTTAFEELAQLTPSNLKRNGFGSDSFSVEDIKRQDAVFVAQRDQVDELRASQASFRRAVEHFDRDLLKVTMKKEEIVRFNKAKSDQGFARMLKSRTLGPDHIEMQIQLRRDIRAIRDRVKKLELYVEGGKKQLTHVSKNKAVLRASSLDMVNRTMNNIEAAIAREREDITSLSRRIGRLDLRETSIGRDVSPALIGAARPSETREASVAVVAAAALNGERAALQLKRALLSARKEPLLTTSIAQAPAISSTVVSKAALSSLTPLSLAAPGTPSATPFRIPTMPMTPPPSTLIAFEPATSFPVPFNLPSGPDDTFAPLADSQSLSSGPRRGGGGSAKHHAKPVNIKKSPSPAPSASIAPAKFEWGPLPALNAKSTTLAFDIRAKGPSGK